MIIEEVTDSTPYVYISGLRTKIQGTIIPEIAQANVSDFCEFECCYIEDVFAEVGGEWWKNDKNSFLYQKLVSADTIEIKLYKDDNLVTTITDDTLGTFTDGFAVKPLYVGFVIDWESVYDAYGSGMYQIITTKVILGTTILEESHKYRLMAYSDIAANHSVRLEITQNGNIIGSQFDYTDLEWTWYYRIKGKLTKEQPELIKDNYIASNYEIKQIQDEIKRQWNLETHLLPSSISNLLTEDNILANQILLTDYNLRSVEIYRRISLNPVSIEFKEKGKNNLITIKFSDKIVNFVKRNF